MKSDDNNIRKIHKNKSNANSITKIEKNKCNGNNTTKREKIKVTSITLKNRRRKIIYITPLYSMATKSNVGKMFQKNFFQNIPYTKF